ncbi:Lar family restriction alleviation protein [Aquidulcibacter sp.]|jgi:hypothetical protein|uniref:Lar family restriction alleviation protein n=1 Tax=Aquidulcibacter sp. TaxID=2052990 RepID=UPI0025BEF1D5|nr:Lar family restriction alleviation protein [Aquidulcibacter sp.]MCA3694230.1 Lar family restriction alleviation protein [Aquidulcibacter sp.]
MTEPLPCPFCGYVGVNVHEASNFRWRVAECDQCGATCGEIRIQTMGEGTKEEWEAVAKEDAIKEWNTRAKPIPQPETP